MNKPIDKVRSHALRTMAAALLSSSLDDSELITFAGSIDSELLEDLRQMLFALRSTQPTNSPRRVSDMQYSRDAINHYKFEDILEFLLTHARSRKIGRARLLKYLMEIDPEMYWSSEESNSSSTDLIRTFLSRSTPIQQQMLIAKISGDHVEDPYLQGISKRP